MDTVKIGLVGTGGIGNHHAKTYEPIEGVEIVAVCDIFRKKALQYAERWGVPKKNVFTSYNKMLEMDEIDAVSVCTYNQAHRRPTVAALKAGKHVLCEKPMAAKLADATAMVRAAKESGKILHIAIHSRYQPGIVMSRKIVESAPVVLYLLGRLLFPPRGWLRFYLWCWGSFSRCSRVSFRLKDSQPLGDLQGSRLLWQS